MFEKIIHKILDGVVNTCNCIKEVMKNRSLPKACKDDKAKADEVKEWAKNNEDCQ